MRGQWQEYGPGDTVRVTSSTPTLAHDLNDRLGLVHSVVRVADTGQPSWLVVQVGGATYPVDASILELVPDRHCVTPLTTTEPVYGLCTACRSVEVRLNNATGTRDLSNIGESASYPTGYGCEVCS